ncbi:hypothetical protein [Hydrogenophaga sp. PAMC20947]|uniref:hypothetical protein n=1 Tax=Hydrogenophaga sp. PAMC20947 TaxID=2565558 RepID=UPI00109DAE84|nr:hypothetical protein [Hydrogenophaga sp. PAMC20947]QCB47640.1 hypothetical protein E5678_17375 [Hydrogenophaga sp. PAMC20947]
MSAVAFQSLLAQLVVDPALRDHLLADGIAAEADLDALERKRLLHVAGHPGLSVNHMLHRGFRLGKLKALLPLTCVLLKSARLQTAVERFWAVHPPRTFYFLPEAIEFCSFLLTQPTRSKYLHEVVAFERAHLELQRARLDAPPRQTVRFQHNPSKLLAQLASGRQPLGLAPMPCLAVGTVDEQGQARWALQM